MADISKIKLPNGNTYDIKDIVARERGLPAGGNAGQVLSKIDGTDYNTEWIDPPSGGGGGIEVKRSIDWDKKVDITLPYTATADGYFCFRIYKGRCQFTINGVNIISCAEFDEHVSASEIYPISTGDVLELDYGTAPDVMWFVPLKETGSVSGDGNGYRIDLLYENTDFSVASGTGYVNLDYTLSKSIDDYDAVIVSAFMVNKETTREQIETIIINKSQYYTRAVSSGTDDYNTRWAFTLNGNYLLGSQSILRSLYFGFADNVTLKTLSRRSNNGEEPKLYKVYGLKLSTTETAVIYSNEERVVGVWTDNKPLYQKNIYIGTLTYDTYWHQIPHNISNLGEVVKVYGRFKYLGDGMWYEFPSTRPNQTTSVCVGCNTTNIQYMNNWLPDAENVSITLQYTKTTDAPGSGPYVTSGSYAHHYSTDEQVVGTWIDGSTLYEKTQYGGITFSSRNTWYDTDITGIDKIISVEGSINRDGEPIGIGYWNSSIISCWIIRNNTLKMSMQAMASNETYTLNYITVRYTKTS